MEQFYAPAVMFVITVVIASLFAVPAVVYSPKSKVMNFYWSGFWMFLALITGLAFGANTLSMLGAKSVIAYRPVVTFVVGAHVAFVMVAWFHICGKAAYSVVGNLYRRKTTSSN